jgi:hypothetical protein
MLNTPQFQEALAAGKYHVLTPSAPAFQKFPCLRCKRLLPEGSFRPIAQAAEFRKGMRSALLLSPICNGCRKQMRGRWIKHPLYSPGLDAFFADRIDKARLGAKQRGIFFGIEKDDALGCYLTQDGKCALSGMPMDWKSVGTVGRGNVAWNAPSIDRIDSDKDYMPDNIQITSALVNRTKGELSSEVFIELCRSIAVHNGVAL